MPLPASAERTALIATVADMVAALGPGALRVAVNGLTGAGKTSFGHELAAALRAAARATMRASMDDFKYPWRHAREHGYDRVSGEGYYRNAYDFGSARDLLLGPAGPSGSGEVVLCGHDPLTGADHRDKKISAPPGAILIADSVFAFLGLPRFDGQTVLPGQRGTYESVCTAPPASHNHTLRAETCLTSSEVPLPVLRRGATGVLGARCRRPGRRARGSALVGGTLPCRNSCDTLVYGRHPSWEQFGRTAVSYSRGSVSMPSVTSRPLS